MMFFISTVWREVVASRLQRGAGCAGNRTTNGTIKSPLHATQFRTGRGLHLPAPNGVGDFVPHCEPWLLDLICSAFVGLEILLKRAPQVSFV